MITETVNAVLKAEQEGNEIKAKANEDAKRIVSDAEAYAESLRKKTVADVKEDRKKVVLEAEKAGEAEYAKILAAGENAARKLEEDTVIADAVKFIKEKVLLGYVRR